VCPNGSALNADGVKSGTATAVGFAARTSGLPHSSRQMAKLLAAAPCPSAAAFWNHLIASSRRCSSYL
jgi:hypothetical protein